LTSAAFWVIAQRAVSTSFLEISKKLEIWNFLKNRNLEIHKIRSSDISKELEI
jgi:hypothetical protein